MIAELGFIHHPLDPCVFLLFEPATEESLRHAEDFVPRIVDTDQGYGPPGALCGVLGIHVDDSASGGRGKRWSVAIDKFRERFPFRKWQVGEGEFTGSQLRQLTDGTIIQSQEAYADKITKCKTRRKAENHGPALPSEVSSFLSSSQQCNWLATQSRPDLSCQVSTCQQCMPSPTVGQVRAVNSVVRRAKQNKDLDIVFQPIPAHKLRFILHTDYSSKGQGGYIIGATDPRMEQGNVAPWSPLIWRSYKCKRVLNSTLSGEAAVLIDGLGHLEWISCFFTAAFYFRFTLESRETYLTKFGSLVVTDCKSVYDHMVKLGSTAGVDDKRCAIDLAIGRESLKRLQATLRWGPTNLQLADSLTKDSSEPTDLLRACIRNRLYQLADESLVLARASEERLRRKAMVSP